MRIDPADEIVGLPAMEARDLLRWLAERYFTVEGVAGRLDLDPEVADQVVDRLLDEGYIERVRRSHDGEQLLENTVQGNALANASAAPRVKRSTAERALSEFLDRVREVNADDDYIFRVDEVIVFGSYLDDDADRLSDVDVAVGLSRRYEGEELRERSEARVLAAQESGRRFSTFLDRIGWPEREVLLFLKGRSPVISMTSTRDGILREAEQLVVYQRDGYGDHGPA